MLLTITGLLDSFVFMEQTYNILNLSHDPIYQELATNYPALSLRGVEIILHLNAIISYFNDKKEDTLSQFKLTSGRFHLLMLINRQSPVKALSPSELAKSIGVTRGTMTQFIDALEKDGFVKRTEDPKDRRGMLIVLTEEGEQKIREVMPVYIDYVQRYAKELDESEMTLLKSIFEKITSSINQIDLNSAVR